MRKKVLIVDADDATRAAARNWVEPLGVEFEEASDANDLLARVKASGAPLVLLDLSADAEAAFAACDTLKSDPATMDVQVLGLSTRFDSHVTAGATEHGFEDFLVKPLQEKELVPIVRFHLDLPGGANDAHTV